MSRTACRTRWLPPLFGVCGIDEHETGDVVRMAAGVGANGQPAEGVSGDKRVRDIFGVEHGGSDRGEVHGGGALRQGAGAAVTGEVDREDAVAAEQLGQHLDPVSRRTGEPVQKEQRLPLTADVVAHRPDRAGLEGRCGRHARTVSSEDHGDFRDAGPLIPANDHEQAMSEPARAPSRAERAFSFSRRGR